jgi:hypothetical protein
MQDDRETLVRELAHRIAHEAADRLIRIIEQQVTHTPKELPAPLDGRLIFINYRRADSEDVCGRVYDRLEQAFGKESIFRDVANIPPGSDFRRVLTRRVAVCDLMIVIMGRDWLNEENHQRLQNEDDFVRFEIETALSRNIPIIPIWVGRRNSMPEASQLPESIRDLVNRQALPVRADPDFHSDMDHLVAAIQDIFEIPLE